MKKIARVNEVLFREAKYFLVALQFLTRIPTPNFPEFETVWLDRSAKYFPLVGILVGGLCAGVFYAALQIWPSSLAACLAIVAGFVITGAFHEDGFADFFDCMGGQTRAQRLEIMKDSRIGTYGTLALISLIALKISALTTLAPALVPVALIAAHAGGRFAAVVLIASLPYAGAFDLAKVKPLATGVTSSAILIALAFAVVPLLLLPIQCTLVALAFGIVAAVFIAWRAKTFLGGYTGDVLGAAEQAFEVAFLLGVAACA